MYLKKIEIAGFKSFADRTVIEFDKGLTAVVGPNGSGKSNITEAIRWVLGEQSAKSLRGGKMPDVIFAGTTKRKQLNIAEVTVVLDNEEKFLPLDFSEVSVTRRLKRTGESEFFINKQPCRLKDVVELFMDSGLGKESFSIISQGKVEGIFNSKPEDRRGIFEEAAGVLKYKQRKTQAERKLFETEDNLNRVQDIVYELEAQLEPLAAQSKVAREFVALKEELTTLDVGVTVKDIEQLKETWNKKSTLLKELEARLTVMTQSVAGYEASLIELRERRVLLDEQLETYQQKLLRTSEAYEQAEGQKNLFVERRENTAKTSADYAESHEKLTQKLAQLKEEREALIADLKQQEQDKKNAMEEVEKLTERVEIYSRSAKEQLADLRSDYVEVMQKQANLGNDLKHLERQYDQESSKNHSAVKRHDDLHQSLAAIQEKKAKAEQELADFCESTKDLTSQSDSHRKKALGSKDELVIKEKQMYDAMGTLQQAKARLKSLQELQESYAGFFEGVRSVLKVKSELKGIVGAVAELVTVPKELSLAIETALGASAQNVIVDDEKAARGAISYLKSKRLGRATFLPLTIIEPRHIPKDRIQMIEGNPGYIGIASDLVTFDAKINPVVKSLLGATILAKDLDSANAIAKQTQYQYRVVSLEGDVMKPGGSMTGGATKKGGKGNLFSKGEELQKLTEQVSLMESELAKREKLVQDLKELVKTSEAQFEITREAVESSRFKEQDLKNKVDMLVKEHQQLTRELQLFEHETAGLNNFLASYEEQKTQLTTQIEALKVERERLDKEMAATDEREEVTAQKREEALKELQHYQARVAVLSEQCVHVKNTLTDKEKTVEEVGSDLARLNQQLKQLTANHSTHKETQVEIEQKMQKLQAEKIEIQEKLVTLKSEREQVQASITDTDEQLTKANKDHLLLSSEKSEVEVLKNRSEVGLDNAIQKLQEEYSMNYEAAKERFVLVEDIAEAKTSIKELKQRIDRLGPVNMAAIEQYDVVNDRYTFLIEQRDDLLEAKGSLFDTMNEMDRVVQEKFEEVFIAIRDKFQVVFPNMFGGGHADLQLTNPDDLLNTGIEIVAQPPGKKLQSLTLLSGGERALTAIALLFSIIQVRPVPFCVLDEVEAALDEANVARFGQYLSHFEDDTQFIVITHRKGTMEAADVLYGVTMQESGISNIVSVRLEDVNDRGDIKPQVGD
ncbi:chromosome segregation protein SMC [Vagococcus sp. PNs007]|uniref:Chromosome partition protein Smc n=1 Tax=Vagococcus proximus TaxID=2991417 RepID=A0ABT5X249_9ENTE|nr:chromosome segregation protein SMC [Vagococcus proximus]